MFKRSSYFRLCAWVPCARKTRKVGMKNRIAWKTKKSRNEKPNGMGYGKQERPEWKTEWYGVWETRKAGMKNRMVLETRKAGTKKGMAWETGKAGMKNRMVWETINRKAGKNNRMVWETINRKAGKKKWIVWELEKPPWNEKKKMNTQTHN